MNPEDPYTLSFNLSSSIGSTTMIPIIFPQDYEVWALHFEDYILGLEEHGTLIWETMTVETFMYSGTRKSLRLKLNTTNFFLMLRTLHKMKKDKLLSNIKPMRIIRFALPPDIFRPVSACETAKEIWDMLKELYSTMQI